MGGVTEEGESLGSNHLEGFPFSLPDPLSSPRADGRISMHPCSVKMVSLGGKASLAIILEKALLLQ